MINHLLWKKNGFASIEQSNDLNTAIYNLRIKEYKHIISTNVDDMAAIVNEMETIKSDIQATMTTYELGVHNDIDLQLYDAFKTSWAKYLTLDDSVIALSTALKTDEAMKIMTNRFLWISFNTATKDLVAVVEDNHGSAIASNKHGDLLYNQAKLILIILVIATTVFTIFMGLLLMAGTLKPINKLQKKLLTLAEKGGDLTQQIDIHTKDEIGNLATSLNKFIANLRTIMIDVNACSEGVQSANLTISKQLKELNENITETSSTTEELAAGMEETAAASEEVNASSVEIETAIESMAQKAQEGSTSVQEKSVLEQRI